MKAIFLALILVFNVALFAQVPTSGLVAYYPFDGNANDEGGLYGNNGTVVEQPYREIDTEVPTALTASMEPAAISVVLKCPT